MIRHKQALKAQVSSIKSGPNAHGPYSCYTASSLPACTYALMGSFFNQLTEKTHTCFTDASAGYTGTPESVQL